VTAVVGNHVVEGVGENLYLTQHFGAYSVQPVAQGGEVYQFEWKTLEEMARQAVAAWMESPSHRANLLSLLYRAHAVGVAAGHNRTVFVTQNLRSDSPPARQRLAIR
jgi:hypothetical protein